MRRCDAREYGLAAANSWMPSTRTVSAVYPSRWRRDRLVEPHHDLQICVRNDV